MHLEDHAGDIVRKARTAAKITVEAAARQAGVPVHAYVIFEETGQSAPYPNLGSLARHLNLHPRRLEAIAAGWLPKPVNVNVWHAWQQITTERYGNAVNCYLVWDGNTREAALFDTGWNCDPIIALVREHGLDVQHLFITHNHEDHVCAMGALRRHFPAIQAHGKTLNPPSEQQNRADVGINVGSLRVANRETPGHSPDGVTYVVSGFPGDIPGIAMVGDCLFAGSMGRGFMSAELLKQKVREQILSLPPSTVLCPGHGPLTTVAEELEHNPFFG